MSSTLCLIYSREQNQPRHHFEGARRSYHHKSQDTKPKSSTMKVLKSEVEQLDEVVQNLSLKQFNLISKSGPKVYFHPKNR